MNMPMVMREEAELCWSPSACIAEAESSLLRMNVPAGGVACVWVSHGETNCGLRRRERCRGLGFGMALNRLRWTSLRALVCAMCSGPNGVRATPGSLPISPGWRWAWWECGWCPPIPGKPVILWWGRAWVDAKSANLIAEFLLLKGAPSLRCHVHAHRYCFRQLRAFWNH